jgi:hypothetical protein
MSRGPHIHFRLMYLNRTFIPPQVTSNLSKYSTVPLYLGTEGCLQQLQAGKPKSPLGTWRGKCLLML